MTVQYFFEQKPYSTKEFETLFDKDYINILRQKKIVTDIENKTMMKFQFVGLLLYHKSLYFVLPKYFKHNNDNSYLQEKMRIVLRVLRKHGKVTPSNHDTVDLMHGDGNDYYSSTFAISRFLIDDFLHYGYFSKSKENITTNGFGEVLWGKTVDELDPLIVNGSPYYFDYFTIDDQVEEANIIIQIHKWAVSYCYDLFGEWLGYSQDIGHFEDSLDQIGSKDYLLGVLTRELNETFIDQKVNLLKVLKILVQSSNDFSTAQLDIYGTKNFEHVWEKVCGYVFDNEYQQFKGKIPSPNWVNFANDETIEKETFKPDVIKTYRAADTEYFIILDAKYYDIKFTESDVQENPSVNDVAKQLLYQKALHDQTKGKVTRNYFLFPQDNNAEELFTLFGKVSLDFISSDPVILVYLSDEKIYNMFLNNSQFNEKDYKSLEMKSIEKLGKGILRKS